MVLQREFLCPAGKAFPSTAAAGVGVSSQHCHLAKVPAFEAEDIRRGSWVLFGFLKTEFHYIVQAVLELSILLSLPYKCWDDRQVPTHSAAINMEDVMRKPLAATQRVKRFRAL